ncbi:MAG: RidA family protein [Gemmatimonadales bacterium]|nr:MAG: RidA family protein [Gemmatimonadales bacterium]
MSDRTEVRTSLAPAAIGPYAQAVVADGWIWVSGQIPLDPETGKLVEGGIRAQTHRVFRSLEAVLEEAGGGLDTVVKASVFLADLSNFEAMNEVYAEYFGASRPARACVEVARLPRDVDVEIEVVARVRS